MSVDGSKIESKLVSEARNALEDIIGECHSTWPLPVDSSRIARCMALWKESVELLTSPHHDESISVNSNQVNELHTISRLPEFIDNGDLRTFHNKSTIVTGMEGLRAFLDRCRLANMYVPRLVLKFKHKGESATDYDELPTVMFCFDEEPMPGWCRLLYLRLSGKTKGRVDIHYRSPESSHRIRSRGDLMSYGLHSKYLTSGESFPLDSFSFSVPFCVCQQPELRDSPLAYIECSYGKCGCNGWVHPVCVGLGNCSEEEMHRLPRIVCPFCTAYLEATDSLQQFTSQGILPLRYLSTGYRGELVRWKTIEVEACNVPHQIYGRNSVKILNECSFGTAVSPREQYLESNESLLEMSSSTKCRELFVDAKPSISTVALVASPSACAPTTMHWAIAPLAASNSSNSSDRGRTDGGGGGEDGEGSVQRKRPRSVTASDTPAVQDNWSWIVRDADNLFKRQRLMPDWCLPPSLSGDLPLGDEKQAAPGRWVGVSGGFLSLDNSWFPSTSTTYNSAFIAAVKTTAAADDLPDGAGGEQEKESDLLYLRRKALQRIYRPQPSPSDEPKLNPAAADAAEQTVVAPEALVPQLVPAETHKSVRARLVETIHTGALRSVKALIPKQGDQISAYNERQSQLFGRALELKEAQGDIAGRTHEGRIFLPPVLHYPARDGGLRTVPIPLPTKRGDSLWATNVNEASIEEANTVDEVAGGEDAIAVDTSEGTAQVGAAQADLSAEQSARRRRVSTGIVSASKLTAFVEQMHRIGQREPSAALACPSTSGDNLWLQRETKRQHRCAICLQRFHEDSDTSSSRPSSAESNGDRRPASNARPEIATVDGRRCHAACAWAWQQASFLRDLCGADDATASLQEPVHSNDGEDAVDVALASPITWPPNTGDHGCARIARLRLVRLKPAAAAAGSVEPSVAAPLQGSTSEVGAFATESGDQLQPPGEPAAAVTAAVGAVNGQAVQASEPGSQPPPELYWDEDANGEGGEKRPRKRQVCALCCYRDDFSSLIDVLVSPLSVPENAQGPMRTPGDAVPGTRIQAHLPCLQHACFAPQALTTLLLETASSESREVSCDICRGNDGPLLLRCAAAGCTVRAHSLCAEIFGQTKMLHVAAARSPSGKLVPQLCLLCPVHRLLVDLQRRETEAADTGAVTELRETPTESQPVLLPDGDGRTGS